MARFILNDFPERRVQNPIWDIIDDTESRSVQPGPWLVREGYHKQNRTSNFFRRYCSRSSWEQAYDGSFTWILPWSKDDREYRDGC